MQLPSPLGQSLQLPYPAFPQIFNPSVMPVVNPIDPQWATGDRSSSNDSSAWQRALDYLGKRGGGTFFVPVCPLLTPWRVKNLVVPSGVPVLILGENRQASSISTPKADPAQYIFDGTDRSGPNVMVVNCHFPGANLGFLETRVFKFTNSNGWFVIGNWFQGLSVGTEFVGLNATDINIVSNSFDGCSVGVWGHPSGSPTPGLYNVNVIDNRFNGNQQDVFVQNSDCASLTMSRSFSYNPQNTGFLFDTCTNLTVEDIKIDTAAKAFSIQHCTDPSIRNIRVIRSTVKDFENVGTFRLFADGCSGDMSDFFQAGVYCGHLVGDRRIVYTRGMPNSLSWTRGDRAMEWQSAIGSPKAWDRLTTGAGNVAGVDWQSEGNL